MVWEFEFIYNIDVPLFFLSFPSGFVKSVPRRNGGGGGSLGELPQPQVAHDTQGVIISPHPTPLLEYGEHSGHQTGDRSLERQPFFSKVSPPAFPARQPTGSLREECEGRSRALSLSSSVPGASRPHPHARPISSRQPRPSLLLAAERLKRFVIRLFSNRLGSCESPQL